jgi:hypothetical protein
MDELVEKNFEILDYFDIPFDQISKFKNLKKNEIDKFMAYDQLEKEKLEPIKDLVQNLKENLNQLNSSIKKDELMVDFLIKLIKIDFPEQSLEQYIEEIKIKKKKIKEINEEIKILKDESKKIIDKKINNNTKTAPKTEQQLLQEKQKVLSEFNKGFILINFPKTIQQAKILERKLSCFYSELEKSESNASIMRNNFLMLCDNSYKIPEKNNNNESGFNLCINLDADSEECFRRSVNRKLDPSTGIIYHFEDNPVPSDDKKLQDRLLPLELLQPNEAKIKDNLRKYNMEKEDIYNFFKHFNSEKLNFKFFTDIKIFPKSEENGKDLKEQINKIGNEINNLISKVIKINTKKETGFVLEQTLTNKEKETNNTYLLGNYDKNSLISHNNIIPSVNSSNIQETLNDAIMEVDHSEIKTSNDEVNSRIINSENNNKKFSTNGNNQIQNFDEDDFNRYNKKFNEAKKKFNGYIIEQIFTKWKSISEIYIDNLFKIFKSLKKQKENLTGNFTKLQGMFIDFLKKPSKKTLELNKFIGKFNNFINDYPELANDETVKSEFRKDLSELTDRIWDYIEEKKDESIEERKKIVNSGYIEKQMEKFYNFTEKIFFLEAEKFEYSLCILRHFYTIMDSKPYIELLNFKTFDILRENLKTMDIKNESKENIWFKKIDILHRNSLRIVVLYDEILKGQDNNFKLNNNNTNNNISVDVSRKGFQQKLRRHHNENTFMEEKKEILIYEEDLKNAIKAEKNKFKFRVTFLNYWSKNVLTKMKKISSVIYNNLDSWIIKSIKAENEAMNSILTYLQKAIEKDYPITLNVELDFFDGYDKIKVDEIFGVEKKV